MKEKSVVAIAIAVLLLCALPCFSQTETATISGRVTDPSGAVVSGADIQVQNVLTGREITAKTNSSGLYVVTGLQPGTYRVIVSNPGFKQIVKPDVILNVQDNASLNFGMSIGSASETVTVEGGAPLVNTENATVSTVVDRQFAENLPMNGRSFQTLVELTPGVVIVPTNLADEGQFSVNGQRATSNYWTVDGVSANIGIGVTTAGNGNGMSGAIGSFSAQGGTNSLVSVDAMQEFRIQTSTYAPEYGRQPGGQISIVTRSGTNQFHGTLFDYLRNDALDANDWFADSKGLPKPKERQNDFGGTFSGPILKDRTFFFFSYEGLRLRLPQVAVSTVPDSAARQSAAPALQPFLNAFPLPNGPDNLPTGVAQFNSSFSSSSTLDAASLRIDHKWNDKLSLFARYNYSPSEITQRGGGTLAPSVVTPVQISTQTGTVGVIRSISSSVVNDLRFNFSRTDSKSHSFLDDFGGAVPLTSLPFPSPFTADNGQLSFSIRSLQNGNLMDGFSAQNVQRQINLVDSVAVQKGTHSLKFGFDLRRLSPETTQVQYVQSVFFSSVAAAQTGNAFNASISSRAPTSLLFRNFSAFAQDTWRISPRLTLTYGMRWDLDFAPATSSGPSFPAVTGFSLTDLSNLAIAPAGTPPYKTAYGSLAPRIGVAYQIWQRPDWQTVIRGGSGVFYDLASSQTGNLITAFPPFGQFKPLLGPASTFPFTPANSAPPVISPTASLGFILALDPNLRLPYTLQWNVALEQALGKQQALTLSYVGASARNLLQTTGFISPPSNPKVFFGEFVDNSGTSDYEALQVRFERRLSHGLQALASYSWAHSIDTASASSIQVVSNESIPGSNTNRGPSDFDIRHTFSLGATYEIPAPARSSFLRSVIHGWSLHNALQIRSAPPVDVTDNHFIVLNGVEADIRPDLVAGQPLYLFGPQFPGGKAFNPAAFTDPPTTPVGCIPLVNFPCNAARQGDLGRNALRGFGAAQWDFAVHRDFPIHESLRLQFRAEMFNVINHPNFAQPSGFFPSPTFGVSAQMLAQGLAGTASPGTGNFSPLYQIGGPRSMQFALKLAF